MKKIFSFFAAMLFAVAANATVWHVSPTSSDAEGEHSTCNIFRTLKAEHAQAGDTVLLADGSYDETQSIYLNNSVVIMAEEGAHPVIMQVSYFKLLASAKFIGIKFQHNAESNGYCMYLQPGCTKLELENCEITNFKETCIMSWEQFALDELIINNCYIHDNVKSAIYDPSGYIANTVITNSTFANNDVSPWSAGLIDIRKGASGDPKLTVDHCTFYHNLLTNSDYGEIRPRGLTGVLVSNCIFAQPEDYERVATRFSDNNGNGEVRNVITHHYTKRTNQWGHYDGATYTACSMGDPLFVDAANANFTLGEGSPALNYAGKDENGADVVVNLGDPRWVPAAEPVEARTLYLQPNADWKSDGARFAICILSNPQEWVDMTAVDGADGYYSAEITTNNQVIFCRMNGATTENNWQNKWNQTQDMTLDEENDMCVISGWDNAGAWSKYVAPVIPDIAWELNGGAMNPKGLASKEALWYQFVADFNACYNKNKELSFEGLTPVTANGLTYNIGIDNLLTETWGWKWLLDYVTDVTTAAIAAGQEYAAGKPVAAMSTEAMRRATVASFWASGQYTSWPGSADFSEAGKPENYLLAYRAMMMPESVDAEFTLVNPTKKGYTFAGWFNNAEFSGEALTSIPANFQGKLYAKWTALPAQQFYLKPGPWYYAANGEKFAMYAFEDGMPEYWSAFMSLAENETSIYTGTIPGGYTHVIFVRFGSASTNPSWSDNMWNQSEDLTIEADKDMYTITAQGPWVENEGSPKAEGAWSKYEYVAPAKFYILGTNGWELTDLIRSDEDSYVLHLEAGYYEIKVLVDGTWATSKGYDDLTEVAAGLSKNEEYGNICFTLDADGDVTVTYTGEVFKLEGSFHVSGTAIDNAAVEAKVVKMIENGQIVIIRNGEKFNAQGQVIR